ncbi:hypothetical protein HGRIS_013997 [Hohenbuehelia grisea]|uniref:HNH nuclease domain-containing protein n=1 Tax=Hohenbuehelia grisea TaxID=104357 RepID=A0ABR3JTG2_9AGAR
MVTVFLASISDPPADRLQLNIPLNTIQFLCLHPSKWLRFVGWAIFLASEGYLSRDPDGNDRLTDEAALTDADILFYNAPGFHRGAVVDVDVVARRTKSQTSVNDLRDNNFSSDVMSRDGRCIFTHWRAEASHIISFARGSEWMSILARKRSIDPRIENINDKRNGLACNTAVHKMLDKREVAILVTPNAILDCNDVPLPTGPRNSSETRNRLLGSRYTLQHI